MEILNDAAARGHPAPTIFTKKGEVAIRGHGGENDAYFKAMNAKPRSR
jgi:hypothetical protein